MVLRKATSTQKIEDKCLEIKRFDLHIRRMSNRVSHAGHFLYNSPCLDGVLLPGSPTAYLLSKPLNWLEFDPSYLKNPKTLGDYIKKFRKDKGISQVELARRIGVNEMTVVNWEIKDITPRPRYLEKLTRVMPGLASVAKHSYCLCKNARSL